MTIPTVFRAPMYHPLFAVAFVLLLVGCSDNGTGRAPMAPQVDPAAVRAEIPIEIRSDAGIYGRLDPVDVVSAELLSPRILRLKVSYGGGCLEHSITAIGGTQFMASYPAQLALFVRHDGGGDHCAALVTQTVDFNITPALDLYRTTFNRVEPFYLTIMTPDVSKRILLLVK